MNPLPTLICLLSLAMTIPHAASQDPTLLQASQTFLLGLTPEEKESVILPFNSDERLNWHFVPRSRLGLSLKQLSQPQQARVMNILRAGLSEQGYTKAETIRQLEIVLREMEGAPYRDPELYYILFFGEPAQDANWMVRYEGHHISFNWTFIDGKLAAANPQFLGANPAEVRIDHPMKGTRALAAEEDLARKLLLTLGDSQREQAWIAKEAPRDILTSNQREAAMQEDLGVPYENLSPEQQGLLLSVIQEIAGVMPPAIAKARLDKIREAGLGAVKFAWMGGLEPGQGHYYRVQGPTFILEYDNVQNNANHVHTVWRDFKGDFGRDLLKEHYARFADPHNPERHDH